MISANLILSLTLLLNSPSQDACDKMVHNLLDIMRNEALTKNPVRFDEDIILLQDFQKLCYQKVKECNK